MKQYTRVYAKIDLDAIHHNMEAMHALLKEDTKIFAVIKTDGYGHGAVPIAKEIESLDYLFGYCTATVEEALILRNHGIKKPILILGYTFQEEYEDIVKNDLRPAVFTLEMAQELSDVAGRLGKEYPATAAEHLNVALIVQREHGENGIPQRLLPADPAHEAVQRSSPPSSGRAV